jgi:hypothetical protein
MGLPAPPVGQSFVRRCGPTQTSGGAAAESTANSPENAAATNGVAAANLGQALQQPANALGLLVGLAKAQNAALQIGLLAKLGQAMQAAAPPAAAQPQLPVQPQMPLQPPLQLSVPPSLRPPPQPSLQPPSPFASVKPSAGKIGKPMENANSMGPEFLSGKGYIDGSPAQVLTGKEGGTGYGKMPEFLPLVSSKVNFMGKGAPGGKWGGMPWHDDLPASVPSGAPSEAPRTQLHVGGIPEKGKWGKGPSFHDWSHAQMPPALLRGSAAPAAEQLEQPALSVEEVKLAEQQKLWSKQ